MLLTNENISKDKINFSLLERIQNELDELVSEKDVFHFQSKENLSNLLRK